MKALVAAGLALLALGPVSARGALPPLPEPSPLERELLGVRFVLKDLRIEEARVLPAAAREAIVAEYVGQSVGAGELREIAARLTQACVDAGYATSGIVFVASDPLAGAASYRGIEGTVAQVRFATPPRVANAAWLTSQLIPDPEAPAHLGDLQERMAALRDRGIVDRINASLEPLPERGRSELLVSVEEPRPWSASIDYDNYHSPVVGAWRPTLNLSHRNITGWGDRADLRVGQTGGLEDIAASWLGAIPRTRVLLGVRFERSDALAIDPPSFRSLEIKTLSETRAADVGWRFATRASLDVEARAAFERRRSDTTLLGLPFSFIAGLPDGRARADVWRAGFLGSARGESDVSFLRVQASFGRATSPIEPVPGAPDERFVTGFLQAQYARRLGESGLQALLRVDGQYTGDQLLPIERLAIGGHSTVRGYRENVILRDRGLIASAEIRAPLWRPDDRWKIDGAAFVDGAWSSNTGGISDPLPSTIASAGVSLLVTGPWGLGARLDLAVPTRRWLTENADVQDRGVHFRLTWNADRVIP